MCLLTAHGGTIDYVCLVCPMTNRCESCPLNSVNGAPICSRTHHLGCQRNLIEVAEDYQRGVSALPIVYCDKEAGDCKTRAGPTSDWMAVCYDKL